MEVCHRVVTTASRGILLPMLRFTFTRSLRQGHLHRSSSLRRVHSLSLSVNLKSNYTRLRSQAITQFVVDPRRVDIPASSLAKLKPLKISRNSFANQSSFYLLFNFKSILNFGNYIFMHDLIINVEN